MQIPAVSDTGNVLLRFESSNFRSFRDPFELSLLATRLADPWVVRTLDWRHGGRSLDFLPVAVILGANGSGKTNVLRALAHMRNVVVYSFREGDPTAGMPREPFALDQKHSSLPTTFEIDVAIDHIRYSYGFEIDSRSVLHEWAYWFPKGKASLLFERKGEEVVTGPSLGVHGRQVASFMRPNALFLSTAAATNSEELTPLFGWFKNSLNLATPGNALARQQHTAKLAADSHMKQLILELLRVADLGISDIRIEKQRIDPESELRFRRVMEILNEGRGVDPDDESFETTQLLLEHQGAGVNVFFNDDAESLGTMAWLGLVGPVIETLSEGSVLLADEIDSGLHPLFVQQLVQLFQDPATNPNGAQLIMNSHDSSLLTSTGSDRIIGRDQVWLTEKDSDGSTRLYPVADFDPRKEESLAKRYLDGRYGGIPLISHSSFAEVAKLVTAGSS